MRLILACCVVLAAMPALASERPAAPPQSATNLLRLHPGPWRVPAPAPTTALRFEPETGEPSAPPVLEALAPSASARARAEAQVHTAADGSRHAVLGDAIRSWTVATLDDSGRLVRDCVHSRSEAQQRVDAAVKQAARK